MITLRQPGLFRRWAQAYTKFMTMEVLFNSVEMELARRWAVGEVPPAFIKRPVMDLRKMVKAWWQLYHESIAAANGRNRTTWERNQSHPSEALDTITLVEALQLIEQLIDLAPIAQFRSIHQAEHYTLVLLKVIIGFYISLTK